MLLKQRQGFVLIFALWVLGFLTVLALGVAAGVRQKIVLLQKLDERSRMHHVLEGAVKYSAAYLINQLSTSGFIYNPAVKMHLHNNPHQFGQFDLGGDTASISYTLADEGSSQERFGVVDEERKINLNTTNTIILQRLIERVLVVKPDEAKELAQAILDWRHYGQSQVKGFFSDEYYENLEYPYAKKDADYETLDELLLVKGMTKDKYEKLMDDVTIYGQGKVNINTAPAQVLYALGLQDALIDKILEVRRGKDQSEGTMDDHIFFKTFDVASEVNAIIKLEDGEIHAIDALNIQNLLTTNSYYFSVLSQAHLAHRRSSQKIRVVISSRENKIVYWSQR
ncbi:MAG: general secretion pathway protein GspK [Candidatus Omnitrophica bacterium]|nr:general secretion pathway protein GspK [Candidatus Omnitrophota bacterium]